jgi:serine acetyltransferase
LQGNEINKKWLLPTGGNVESSVTTKRPVAQAGKQIYKLKHQTYYGFNTSGRRQTPQMGTNCFSGPNATIVGNVVMGDDCSVWFNTVVRGDVNFITIGSKVNVQDGACIHCTYQKYGTTIGNNVSIGHNAIVHGCTINDNVLMAWGRL